jgi:hypothetical protein
MIKSFFTFRNSVFSLCLLAVILPLYPVFGQTGYPLQPVSGADGVFETVEIDGKTVYRSIEKSGRFELYMYFRCVEQVRNRTVYLEVTYLDIGYGYFRVQYNSSSSDYQNTTSGYENFVLGTHRQRTAVFELPDADFRNAQNLQSDLRLSCDGSLQFHILAVTVYLQPTPLYLEHDEDWSSPYSGPPYTGESLVDASTITGKVICGYQGWFRAAGDPSGVGWVHYVHGDFSDLTVEMWPDMLEYSTSEKYPVPGWTHADGRQAYLFSSANKRTVLRHFQWMEAYGIDGVAVQRFVVGLSRRQTKESFRIPGYAREAANRTGRMFYIMYDMSGSTPENSIELMSSDWTYLVDTMKITEDDRYLFHHGKPVVGIFGFFSDRFGAADAHRILDVFQNDGPYSAFVAGSGQWWWRSESATGWSEVFKRMDAWIPWNVGNYSGQYARTDYWAEDQSTIQASGVMYIPLVYPGFSWDNLQNDPPGTSYKSRLKGRFLWRQFLAARDIEAQAVYVAMFDEIDEGTAIFKVTNDLPVNHYFIDLEGLPSDFYLSLTGFGTKLFRDEIPIPSAMPDFAERSQPSIPALLSPTYGDSVTQNVFFSWISSKHLAEISGYELEIDSHVTEKADTFHVARLEEGNHTARVRAINGLNNTGGWSEPVSFVVVEEETSVGSKSIGAEKKFTLAQNYPNPFNSSTTIKYTLLKPEKVRLKIYNALGEELETLVAGYQQPGMHSVVFDAGELHSGIVFCRLQTGSVQEMKKMILIR